MLFDRFGNAITNITAAELSGYRSEPVTPICRNHRFTLVSHYAAGRDQSAVALINSDGLLELTTFSGSARRSFGLQVGDRVTITRGRP